MKEVTDPEVLKQLDGGSEVTDPSLLAQLEGKGAPGIGSRVWDELKTKGLVGGAVEGAADALTSLASSVVAAPVSGLAGLAHLAGSAVGAPGRPADTVRSVQSALTYTPKTATGEALVGAVSYPFEKLAEGAEWAGDKTFEATGSPLAATAVRTGIEALPLALGGAAPKARAMRVAKEQELSDLAAKNTQKDAALKKAQDAGYVVTPSQAGSPSVLESVGGKVKTQQAASIRNADRLTSAAKRELGLPDDAPLSRESLNDYRASQYQSGYLPIERLGTPLQATPQFINTVRRIDGSFSAAGQKFPNIIKNKEIEQVKQDLLVSQMDPADSLMLVRKLREDANGVSPTAGSTEKAVGRAKMRAANAIEDLIDTNLQQMGRPELLQGYRDARKKIAQSFDVEKAINPSTGVVVGQKLIPALKKGRLSGELKTGAESAAAFDKSFQDPAKIGGVAPFSKLDAASMAISAASGGKWGAVKAGVIAAGGAPARSIMLSKGFQKGLQPEYGLPLSMRLAGPATEIPPRLLGLESESPSN